MIDRSSLSRADACFVAHPWVTRGALFLAAGLARLLLLYETTDVVGFRSAAPGLDVALNWSAATHLHHATPAPVFELMAQSAPLYPWLLALGQMLLGEEVLQLRLVTALLGAARFPLLYEACRLAGARPCAAFAAVLLSGWAPAPIYADTTLLKATLDLTLAALFQWSSLVLLRDRRRLAGIMAWGGVVGGLAAVAALSQLNTVLYGFAVVCALASSGWPRTRRLCAIFSVLLVLCSVVGCWAARDQTATTAWLGRTGFELFLGNRPEATGYYTPVEGVPPFPFGHAFVARIALENELGHSLTPPQADHEYWRRAASFWRQRPAEAVLLALRKVVLFFNAFEARDTHYLAWVMGSAAWMPPVSSGFSLFAVFGVAGLLFPPRQLAPSVRTLLVVTLLVVLAANVATFVNFRFRLPSIVPLCVASSLFLTRIFAARLSAREIAWLTLSMSGLAAVVFAPTLPKHVVEESMRKAQANAARSLAAETDASVLKGLASHSPASELQRAQLLVNLHRYTEAHRALQTLYGSGNHDPWVVQAWARYLLWANDLVTLRQLFADTPDAWSKPEAELSPIEFQRLLQLRAGAVH